MFIGCFRCYYGDVSQNDSSSSSDVSALDSQWVTDVTATLHSSVYSLIKVKLLISLSKNVSICAASVANISFLLFFITSAHLFHYWILNKTSFDYFLLSELSCVWIFYSAACCLCLISLLRFHSFVSVFISATSSIKNHEELKSFIIIIRFWEDYCYTYSIMRCHFHAIKVFTWFPEFICVTGGC